MILALPFGVAVGLSMGALGAGGSLLAIPVLVHVAGLDVHAATTASLLVVGAGAVVGTIPHSRAGVVRLHAGVVFAVIGSVGAVAGSWLNQRASEASLAVGFSLLAVTMAALLARRTAVGRIAADETSDHHLSWPRVVILATAVGLLTGLFGVGGGFMIVPALVLALGLSMREAVGTSLVVIAINAAVAMAARYPSLDIDWAVVGPFAGAGIVGVVLGSIIARRSAPARLGYALAGLLVVVAGVMGLPAATDLAGR